jgi:subtilisin family serine protease
MGRNRLSRCADGIRLALCLVVGLTAFAAADLTAAAVPPLAPRISPEIFTRVEEGARNVPALITLRDSGVVEDGSRIARPEARRQVRVAELADEFIRDYGATGLRVRQRFSHLPILAVDLDGDVLASLAADPRVVAVTPSRRFHALDADGNTLMNVPAVASLGYDGNGVGIAVLDSGVDYTHPELAPGGTDASAKTVKFYDAVDHDGDPQDGYGHGTQVAGIAAGSQTGVARGARVVAVRVLDNNGEAKDTAQVLEGINAVIASVESGNPYNIRVANMSFGSSHSDSNPPFPGPCDDVAQDFATAFDILTEDGVIPVVSAGNDGCSNGIAFPACISSALAVGAVFDARICTGPFPNNCTLEYDDIGCDGAAHTCSSDTGADRIACYSDSGDKLDVWAPAGCAAAPARGGGTDACFDGTSAAAPYASGVAALLAQAFPSASAETLRNTLRDTGRPITDDRNGITRGRIDALEALSTLQACTAPATPLGLASSLPSPCQDESFDLTWNPVTAASGYTVQVARDVSFATGLSTFTTTQSVLPFVLTGTDAYTAWVHVRADSECGVSSPYSASVQLAYQGTCGGDGNQTTYLLGIAHGPGVPPSFFYSDLAILNTAALQVDLTLTFHGSSGSSQFTATLAGHQQGSWDDVLVTAFGLAGNDVGLIRVDSSGPVKVLARTYSRPTDAPDRSYGQYIIGLTPADALTADRVGYFMALRSDNPYGGSQPFRSNVVFGNVGTVSADVEVRFFSNGGAQIGSVTLSGIAPENQKLATYALPAGFSAAFAEVRVQPVGARVVGVASVVDGTSTDPTTIPMTIP